MGNGNRKMNNRGNIIAGLVLFWLVILLFLTFFGTALFEILITGELHEITNDLYLINRNVLMALSHDLMGEDINSFYEEDVKKLVEEEIKRQWNIDVSCDTEYGKIARVDIIDAKIINEKDKMYIETELNIKLRPVLFNSILKDKLCFNTIKRVKVEKMRR